MMHWISYEENLRGVYSLDDLRRMFKLLESRKEWENFVEWLAYMERCGVFFQHEFNYGPCQSDALGNFWEKDSDTEWSAYLFEDDADTEPAVSCYVEECNGFYNAEVEYKFWPYTEYKREQFATLEDAKAYCSSWAYFPEEG